MPSVDEAQPHCAEQKQSRAQARCHSVPLMGSVQKTIERENSVVGSWNEEEGTRGMAAHGDRVSA